MRLLCCVAFLFLFCFGAEYEYINMESAPADSKNQQKEIVAPQESKSNGREIASPFASQKTRNDDGGESKTHNDDNNSEKKISDTKNTIILTKAQFIERVEKNAIALIEQNAANNALAHEGKAASAWNPGSVEVTQTQSKSDGQKSSETEILATFNPKLPWVSYAISKNYQTKTLKAAKSYALNKTLAIAAAKALYLDYLELKEQQKIAKDREKNAQNQLKISRQQLDSGRISKAQYLFFQSDYLATGLALEKIEAEVATALSALAVALGLDASVADIKVEGINFHYVKVMEISTERAIAASPYLGLVDLEILDYKQSGDLALLNYFDSVGVSVGASVSNSGAAKNNALMFKLNIPLPLTTKNYHEKNAFSALRTGAIYKKDATRDALAVNIESLKAALKGQQSYIALSRQNEENKRELADIIKIGYAAGKISAFEYLSVRNDYLNAMVLRIEAKREYVRLLRALEEALGADAEDLSAFGEGETSVESGAESAVDSGVKSAETSAISNAESAVSNVDSNTDSSAESSLDSSIESNTDSNTERRDSK